MTARLHRNESPFGASAGMLRAMERQRTGDRRTIGLNRYADFISTDMLVALQKAHGLTQLNYTPLAGTGEVALVLAAALCRGGELVQSWPIHDPISVMARAWGARVKRVPLTARFEQDLDALVAAVGPDTRLVHLANPHDPSGRSFGHDELVRFLARVRERKGGAFVWVDETHADYSSRDDFPRTFELVGRDVSASKLCVSRSLSGAAGLAGLPTAYLAASQSLTQQTEGLTSGFVVPGVYGWANPEGNVGRLGEKALLAALAPEGREHLRRVRELNRDARAALRAVLVRHGFAAVPSDSSYLLARAPDRFTRGGLAPELRRRGVLVRSFPRSYGTGYRGWVRVSVPSARDLRRLDRALAALLPRAASSPANVNGGDQETAVGDAPAVPVSAQSLSSTDMGTNSTALVSAGVPVSAQSLSSAHTGTNSTALGATAMGPALPHVARQRRALAAAPAAARHELTRRRLLAGAAGAGLGTLIARHPLARAFPPDSFFDRFDLARMIYHENPVGPHPAALEAVRSVLGRGPGGARSFVENDEGRLVDAILAYQRRLRPSSARKLKRNNMMLLLGSAEGLTLAADAFVAGGTLVGEWPAYRIIRERVLQQKGRVVDVRLRADDQPDYAGLLRALRQHPGTGLLHFNAQNNPMGSVIQRAEFDRFAATVYHDHPDVVILVDESDTEYMEAGEFTRQPDYARHVVNGKNLVHLQTFSHAFALTGLRIGYLTAPPRLIARMRNKRIAQPVSEFAHAAALASLKVIDEQVKRSNDVIHEGRRYLYSEFDRMGLAYHRSQGHFVMVNTGINSTTAWLALIGQGVLVRDGREWELPGYVRVCPGLPDENRRFVASLRTVLAAPDPANLPRLPIDPAKFLNATPSLRAMRDRNEWIAQRVPRFGDDGTRAFTLADLT